MAERIAFFLAYVFAAGVLVWRVLINGGI